MVKTYYPTGRLSLKKKLKATVDKGRKTALLKSEVIWSGIIKHYSKKGRKTKTIKLENYVDIIDNLQNDPCLLSSVLSFPLEKENYLKGKT